MKNQEKIIILIVIPVILISWGYSLLITKDDEVRSETNVNKSVIEDIQGYFYPKKEVIGIVNYDDCREKIFLNTKQYNETNGTFVCSDSNHSNCVKAIYGSAGECQKVYLYSNFK